MCDPPKLVLRAIGSHLGPRSASKHEFEKIESPGKYYHRTRSLLFLSELLFLFCLLRFITPISAGLVLSDHIRHFEPVFYDSSSLRAHHHRAKRDASHTVALDFVAHNREFKIRLKRDSSIFADDVVFETTDGIVDFDVGKVYSGTLEDDDFVDVHGVVTKEGLFDGHVTTPNEVYYVEPSDRYIKNVEFHSVMYKASDVLHPLPARCASEQLHLRGKVHNPWVSNSPDDGGPSEGYFEPSGESVVGPLPNKRDSSSQRGTDNPRTPSTSTSSTSSTTETPATGGLIKRRPVHPKLEAVKLSIDNKLHYKNGEMEAAGHPFSSHTHDTHKVHHHHHYHHSPLPGPTRKRHHSRNATKFSNEDSYNELFPEKSKYHSRRKRSLIDPKKTTCMLYLQADHLFFREEVSEEACIDKITRHVQRVNNIYKSTDFDRDGKEDQVGFMIKRIKIHTENATRDPNYRFPSNYGVEKFLELFSEEDYDAFCLAYMFTYRDFEGGTLGLAWTGDLKNAGGVCEKNGHYRGSLKSLNTGIVTLLNYGKKVPPAVSHVTLAHEIGHNFGSPHDPEKDLKCTPGGENGNYIMFARATSGDKRNNNKFSPCSLKQINSVLNSKARDAKGCFTEPQRAICGNGVVEEGEECDCGWQEDCEESCCFPMVTNPSRHHKPCSLRPSKICSPSQGPCCTKECGLKQGDLCREDNGCRDSSFCNGMSPYCPSSINKPNKTICKDEFVCFKGECTGSICLAYGLDSCQCIRESGDAETKSCELCCKLPGEDQPCLSSFEWNVPPYNIPDMYAKPGTPCDNYKGYCDVFQKCREVDPSGPLATLRKILLSNESLANLQRWIVDHWYAVLFVVIALIIILVAITKVFGKQAVRLHSTKRPQKKKKKKTIMHKNSTTNGHFVSATDSPEGANHVIHPTVIRTNIPFKRKVNEVKRAATKAKRVAKSQLGRPYKRSSEAKRAEGAVTSPTESDKSMNVIAFGKLVKSPSKSKEKEKVSSRFSIISFKPFRPKSLSPDKSKTNKVHDKRKSGIPGGRRSKSKSKGYHRSRSPDKKKKSLPEIATAENLAKLRSRSPSKRRTLEDERRKSKHSKTHSPEKALRSTSPEKSRKHRPKSPERNCKLSEGNWLINKFLADEEKIAKPIMNGSLAGFLVGSLSSINTTPLNGTASASPSNGSPIISHTRSSSTRALLPSMNHASPIRGIVNEAFIGSPRNARTHSSLRVTKSVSPEADADNPIYPNKYRRSISTGMVAYHSQAAPSQDKRKRSTIDERYLEKRRRFSSPEKPQRPLHHSLESAKSKQVPLREKLKVTPPPNSSSSSSLSKGKRRKSSGSIPSSINSSFNSFSAVPEKVREKLSLITSSPTGSSTSILMPSDNSKEPKKELSPSAPPKLPPKNWV